MLLLVIVDSATSEAPATCLPLIRRLRERFAAASPFADTLLAPEKATRIMPIVTEYGTVVMVLCCRHIMYSTNNHTLH